MIDYGYVLRSYIEFVNSGITGNVAYEELEVGNRVLNAFCLCLIDNSDYSESQKKEMMDELIEYKEILSRSISCNCKGRQ